MDLALSSDSEDEAVGRRVNDCKGSDVKNAKKSEEYAAKEKQKTPEKVGPRMTLDAEMLKGPNGLASMGQFFSDMTLSGRREDVEKDLDEILGRLEKWVDGLHPNGQFNQTLKKIEELGSRKDVKTYLKSLRLEESDDGE